MKVRTDEKVLIVGVKPAGYTWPGVVRVVKRFSAHAEVEWDKGNKSATLSYTNLIRIPKFLQPFL